MCCFCSPEFQSKNTGKREPKKKKEKEPFQHEILRTTSVLPNFNLETLRRESQKKKGEGTIPTRNSKCCFCSPKFQSKNAGNREPKKKEKAPFQQEILNAASVLPNFNLKTLETGSQKKKKKHHSNKKF